jgi:hypothetical protein
MAFGVACNGGSSSTPHSQTGSDDTPPPAAAADPATSISDGIVSDIFLRQETETPDTTTDLIPPSLSSFFKVQDITLLTVKTRTDPLVERSCQLAKLPFAKKVLETAADLILTKLRGKGGGKGIGLLVSATKFGCDYLVPFLSQKAITSGIGPLPQPLPTKGPTTNVVDLNESAPLKRGSNLNFDVTVLAVDCVTETQTLAAQPGFALIAANIRIESHSDGVDYDAAYWDLTTDGVNPAYFVPTSDLPYSPYLTYGSLDANQYAEGWLLFHVLKPTKSIEVMYRGNKFSAIPLVQVNRGICLGV